MRREWLGLLLVGIAGGAWFREAPEQKVAPGATMIYHGGGYAVFMVCNGNDRIYMTEKNPMIAVVKDGCAPPAATSGVQPVLNIPAPIVTVPAPIVHVEPPIVHVPAPIIQMPTCPVCLPAPPPVAVAPCPPD